MYKLLLIFILSFLSISKCADMNITVQSAWNTNSYRMIYSVGALFKSNKLPYTYYEFGITSLPQLYKTTSQKPLLPTNEILFTLYGIYAGYYIALLPIFRPGVVIGSVLEQNALYSGNSSRPYKINKLGINYYAGISIHALLFTFLITNKGIGGGLNIPLGN